MGTESNGAGPAGPGRRGRQTARDLLLSLGVVAGFVLFLVVMVARPQPQEIREVDPAPMLAAARQQADYPVLAPGSLSDEWRATSARFTGNPDGSTTWFLGYVTPQGEYVGVAQSDGRAAEFIEQQTAEGQAVGQQTAAGRTWQQYQADNGDTSLVASDKDVTTVVTGTLPFDELAAFAEQLQD